jgi:hypothetical protein
MHTSGKSQEDNAREKRSVQGGILTSCDAASPHSISFSFIGRKDEESRSLLLLGARFLGGALLRGRALVLGGLALELEAAHLHGRS